MTTAEIIARLRADAEEPSLPLYVNHIAMRRDDAKALIGCAEALEALVEEAALYLGRLAAHDAQMIGNDALVQASAALAALRRSSR